MTLALPSSCPFGFVGSPCEVSSCAVAVFLSRGFGSFVLLSCSVALGFAEGVQDAGIFRWDGFCSVASRLQLGSGRTAVVKDALLSVYAWGLFNVSSPASSSSWTLPQPTGIAMTLGVGVARATEPEAPQEQVQRTSDAFQLCGLKIQMNEQCLLT